MTARRMDVVRYDFAGDNATYLLNTAHDENGMEYILAEDVWRAIEGEATAALRASGKAGMAIIDARMGIDAEVDQAGDSAWFDVPDPRRPAARRTLRFVNKYGAERMAAVHPWSAVGKRLRDFLIRLHKEYDAKEASTTTVVASSGVMLDGLGAEIAKGLMPLLQSFGHEIKQVKDAQPTSRPPDQFITVRQACIEKSLDFTTVVSGKQTADQYLGNWMRQAGVESGDPQSIRVGDSSLMRPAQTYRRRDIYSAIDRLMAERQVA